MKNTSLENLQIHLDIVKWHKSENNGKDMCRYLEYCKYCKWEDEFKCARAYLRMVEADEAKTAEKIVSKKTSPKAKVASKKPAKKVEALRIEDDPQYPEIVKAYKKYAKANKGQVQTAVEIKKGVEKIYGAKIKRCYPAFFSEEMVSYKSNRPSLFVPKGFSEKTGRPTGPYFIP